MIYLSGREQLNSNTRDMRKLCFTDLTIYHSKDTCTNEGYVSGLLLKLLVWLKSFIGSHYLILISSFEQLRAKVFT